MILFDIEPLQNDAYKTRGIGRYVRNLLAAARDAKIPFAVTYNPNLVPPDINRLSVPEQFIPATRANFAGRHFDWLLTMSPFEASLGSTHRLFRSCFPKAKIATIAYDLIPMVFEANYLADPLERARYAIGTQSMLAGDKIFSISEHTRLDIEKYLSPKCDVTSIGTGVDEKFFLESHIDEEEKLVSFFSRFPFLNGEKFIFTVSGIHKSKNLRPLMEAYGACPFEFRVKHPLVIGGGFSMESRQHLEGEWEKILINQNSAPSRIFILDHVSDEDVQILYNLCHLFVYPSLYEGFGLPLAEAITCGAVCISSDRSSLKEIMPLSDFQFNPNSPEQMRDRIELACSDVDLRRHFREWAKSSREKFRWTHVGRKLSAGMPVNARQNTPILPETKHAVIGPLRPTVSGIANYNSEILPFLGENYQWFCPHGFSSIHGERRSLPLSSYDKEWAKFDSLVYVIGNSFHHLPALHRLQKRPGIVWLHDVRLPFLTWDYAHATNPQNPTGIINEMATSYGVHFNPVSSFNDLDSLVFSFAKTLLKNATGFVVHSQQAKELLIEDLGGTGNAPPIEVIPLTIVPPSQLPVRQRWDGTRPLRVGTLGFLHPIRDPETIIRACGLLATPEMPVTFVVLGQAPEDYIKQLKSLAHRMNVVVEMHGYLDDEEFAREIAKLDVAVQIRKRTNGESSATISEAITVGIPIITNIPSAQEYWGDYVLNAQRNPQPSDLSQLIQRSQAETPSRQDLAMRCKDLEAFSYPRVAGMFEDAIVRILNKRRH